METLWQDVRYGARMLAQRPGFTAVVVLTLALGIGANTAIFSVVNGVLLRPLPHQEPDQLVMIYEVDARPGHYDDHNPVSVANFGDWKKQNQVFEEIAAFGTGGTTLTGTEEPERLSTGFVTAGFFSTLRAQFLLGRAFLPEEDQPGEDNVAVLSHALWQRRFGGDTAIIGKTITLNGNPIEIVGVLAPGFQFLSTTQDVWVPFGLPPRAYQNRKSHNLTVIARLKPATTIAQAQAEMNTIADRLRRDYPEWMTGFGVNVVALREEVVGRVRPALLVLLGAAGLVLLIAVANVANLLLARATFRQKEVAIRTVLGAGRARILRQLVTESLLLALLGGGLGLLLASWGTDVLLALAPADLPRLEEVATDRWVLGFALAASVVTGMLFGLAPALNASRADMQAALKEGGRTHTRGAGHQRLRRLLVVSELALSFMLLIGAGLMIKSVVRLLQVNPGFQPNNVLTATVSLPSSKYEEIPQQAAFFEQALEEIQRLPGVQEAGATRFLPFADGEWTFSFLMEGGPPPETGEKRDFAYHPVSSDYFRTLGIPLVEGRLFTESDNQNAPPVVIINQSMRRRFWPAENPIGRRISFQGPDGPWWRIVGIVADVQHDGLAAEAAPAFYAPHAQRPWTMSRRMTFVVRTASDPMQLVPLVRGVVRKLDPDLPLIRVQPLEQIVAESIAQPRFSMTLLSLFAAVALVLALVGIYGVVSYSVSQRTQEIGIRLALGALPKHILKLVVGQGVHVALLGIGIGLVGALALTRYLESLLFGVTPTDAVTFAAVALLLIATTLAASYLPARRASRLDPMAALRYE